MSDRITPEDLLARIESGRSLAVLDVRSDREFADGHVPGATHIPFWLISKRIADIPAGKEDEVVVYCGHGPRAILARRTLRKHGFTRVVFLEGHFSKWRTHGRREERGDERRIKPR